MGTGDPRQRGGCGRRRLGTRNPEPRGRGRRGLVGRQRRSPRGPPGAVGGPGRAAVATETGPPRPARRGEARSGRTRRSVSRERGRSAGGLLRGWAAPRPPSEGTAAARLPLCRGSSSGASTRHACALCPFLSGDPLYFCALVLLNALCAAPETQALFCATVCSPSCLSLRDPNVAGLRATRSSASGPSPGLHLLLGPASPCSRFPRQCFLLPPFHYVFVSLSALKVYKPLVLWRT